MLVPVTAVLLSAYLKHRSETQEKHSSQSQKSSVYHTELNSDNNFKFKLHRVRITSHPVFYLLTFFLLTSITTAITAMPATIKLTAVAILALSMISPVLGIFVTVRL